MYRFKRTITLLIAIILLCSICSIQSFAQQYSPKYTSYADGLYELGLFKGTGVDSSGNPKYELNRQPTRAETLVVLIRLLGEEDEALSWNGTTPFNDTQKHWAEKYMGYGYEKGYVKGMTLTSFQPDTTVISNMWLTMLLRAMNYDDSKGDFSYGKAFEKAGEIGLCQNGSYSSGTFYRDDVVYTSYNALGINLANSDKTLAQDLINKGTIEKDTTDNLGITSFGKITGLSIDGTTVSISTDNSVKDAKINIVAKDADDKLIFSNTIDCSTGKSTEKAEIKDLPSEYIIVARLLNSKGISITDAYVVSKLSEIKCTISTMMKVSDVQMPVSDVKVSLSNELCSYSAIAAEDGNTVISVPKGSYKLTVSNSENTILYEKSINVSSKENSFSVNIEPDDINYFIAIAGDGSYIYLHVYPFDKNGRILQDCWNASVTDLSYNDKGELTEYAKIWGSPERGYARYPDKVIYLNGHYYEYDNYKESGSLFMLYTTISEVMNKCQNCTHIEVSNASLKKTSFTSTKDLDVYGTGDLYHYTMNISYAENGAPKVIELISDLINRSNYTDYMLISEDSTYTYLADNNGFYDVVYYSIDYRYYGNSNSIEGTEKTERGNKRI